MAMSPSPSVPPAKPWPLMSMRPVFETPMVPAVTTSFRIPGAALSVALEPTTILPKVGFLA